MKIIPISGIIANFEMDNESNVTPASLRKSLKDANGEDILVTINSPGGGVFAGLEMFSLLKNYSGNVETRIVSLAASMGSVLALAGDKISAESTAMYFIHNAQSYASGDYRDLAKESKWLKDISDLIANLYEKYTSLSLEDAVELMDADTQFFGNDLELLGFNIIDVDEDINEYQSRINSRLKFSEVQNKIRNENYNDDLGKVAASLDYEKYGLKKVEKEKNLIDNLKYDESKINAGIEKAHNPASAGKNNTEVQPMTLNELMAANPAAKIELDSMLDKHGKDQFEAGKQSVLTVAKEAAKIATSDSYHEKIKSYAVGVMSGENSMETLNALVVHADMTAESTASTNAKDETEEIGATAGENIPEVTKDGIIKNSFDFESEVARMKNKSGVEVR